MTCRNCNAPIEGSARFCKRCGKAAGVDWSAGTAAGIRPAERPDPAGVWYLRPPILILSLLAATPLGIGIVLRSPAVGRGWKVLGTIAGGVYLVVLIAVVVILSPPNPIRYTLADWFGWSAGSAGRIEFGNDLGRIEGQIEVIRPQTTFRAGESLAYIAYLTAGVGQDQTKVVINRIEPGRPDELIDSRMVTVSNPGNPIVWGKLTFDESSVLRVVIARGPGLYRIQFTNRGGDRVLAEGTFRYAG